MNAIQISYTEVRERMRPGDVIAFGGKGNISELIKFATLSDVSHVAVILQTKILNDDEDRFFNEIIESTTLNGAAEVRTARLSDCLNIYEGEIWWLPLDERTRSRFDEKKFYNFLFRQVGKGYDMRQAVKAGVDLLDRLPFSGGDSPTRNKEDFSKFFCSELVAAAFEEAGVTGSVNASEVTPVDLCRWCILSGQLLSAQGRFPEKNFPF